MKVYKGTDKDIKCRGYQFTPGVEAVEESAKLCSSGFHACETPLDVLAYYAPSDGSRYFEAELEEVSPERENDSKVCGKRITLGAEIGIPGLIKAHVEYVKSKCERSEKVGYSSALTGGDWSALRAGQHSRFRGGGMWSVFACEMRDEDCNIVGVKTAVVDGETIKPDVWYKLVDGEWMEVQV